MGLDTTHGCWHSSYSSFSNWRAAVAETAGYPMTIRPSGGGVQADVDYASYPSKTFNGEWGETPEDILLVLIVHSDCEGWIEPAHAGPLADRLEELMPRIEPEWCRQATPRWIAGLRSAAEVGERVEFR